MLSNLIGDGEKPLINVQPYAREWNLTPEDLAPFLEQDAEELRQVKREYGLSLPDITDFMEYLLAEAFTQGERIGFEAGRLRNSALKRLPLHERVRRSLAERSFSPSVSPDDLEGGEHLQYERLVRESRRNVVDGFFRVEMLREAYFGGRWSDLRCPFEECGNTFRGNQDVYFDSTVRMVGIYDPIPHVHPELRLNEISIHLVRDHALFQKGESPRDQRYPTSPLAFVNDFYLPWKAHVSRT